MIIKISILSLHVLIVRNFFSVYFIIIPILLPLTSRHARRYPICNLSIAAFDDPVFFHGRFHAFVAPLDSRFKIPDATMEELSFRGQRARRAQKYSRIIELHLQQKEIAFREIPPFTHLLCAIFQMQNFS